MTILEMPATGAALQEFEPQRVDYGAHEAGGRNGGVQAGFPLWRAVWTVGKVGVERSDQWRAWHIRMRGSQRRFYGRDLARPYPRAHINGFAGMTRAGGGAFDGSALSWSETINADQESEVTLTGLPVGLELSLNDYIDWRWTTGSLERRALVRVVVGGVANGSGQITVTSEPPIPPVVPIGAVAHLDRPACIMKIESEPTRLDAVDRRRAIRGGTIVAIEDLRP